MGALSHVDFSDFEGGDLIDFESFGQVIVILNPESAAIKHVKGFENAGFYSNYHVTEDKLSISFSIQDEIGLYFDSETITNTLENNNWNLIFASYNLEDALDLEDFDFNNELLVYPNPAQNSINVKFNDFERLEVYNIIGQLIIETYEESVDVSEYENGVYIIKVYDSNGNSDSTKLIKN